MTLMEFRTKIVEAKKNPKARLAVVGAVLLVVSVVLSLMNGYERYAMWGFGVAFILLIGGAIFGRGDLAFEAVSAKDLVINDTEIRVGETVYALGQVQDIDFMVVGYDGMQGRQYRGPSEGIINGMDNYLDFTFGGEQVKCYFYLAGPEAVQQLGLLFKEFYNKRINFVERNMGSKTYLFEPVTQKQWEDRMTENGYV